MSHYPSSPSYNMAVDSDAPPPQHYRHQEQQRRHPYIENQEPYYPEPGAQQAYGMGSQAYPQPPFANYGPMQPYMAPYPGYYAYGTQYGPAPPPPSSYQGEYSPPSVADQPRTSQRPSRTHSNGPQGPPPRAPLGLPAPSTSRPRPEPRGSPGSSESRCDSGRREVEDVRKLVSKLKSEISDHSKAFHNLRDDYDEVKENVDRYRERAHKAEVELEQLKTSQRWSQSPERCQDRDDRHSHPHPRPRSPPRRNQYGPRSSRPDHQPRSAYIASGAPRSTQPNPSKPAEPTHDPMSLSANEDEDKDGPLWDEEKGKLRHAAMQRREGMQGAKAKPGLSVASARPATAPTSLFVACTSVVDPPGVPSAEPTDVPKNAPWPELTPIKYADVWGDYMPYTSAQLKELLRSARDHGSGAHNRVIDLLYQYDHNGLLGRYRMLQALKSVGKKPAPSNNTGKGPTPPRRSELLQVWQDFWRQTQVPAYMCIETNGVPTLDATRRHILLCRILPSLAERESNHRAQFLNTVNELFSVPDLYETIVSRGKYPVAPREDFQSYPYLNYANVSMFDITRWYAHCGLSAESVGCMQPVAYWFRQVKEKRGAYSMDPFETGITGIAQLDHVPSEEQLCATCPAFPILVPTIDDDTVMDTEGAPDKESSGIATDEAKPPTSMSPTAASQ